MDPSLKKIITSLTHFPNDPEFINEDSSTEKEQYVIITISIPMKIGPNKTIETITLHSSIEFEMIDTLPSPISVDMTNESIKQKMNDILSNNDTSLDDVARKGEVDETYGGGRRPKPYEYVLTNIQIPVIYKNDNIIESLSDNIQIEFISLSELSPVPEYKITNSFIKEKIKELCKDHPTIDPELQIIQENDNKNNEMLKSFRTKFLTEESKGKKKKKKEREPSPEVYIREKPKSTINFIN